MIPLKVEQTGLTSGWVFPVPTQLKKPIVQNYE